MKAENLKALVYGHEVNDYQKSLAIQELEKLLTPKESNTLSADEFLESAESPFRKNCVSKLKKDVVIGAINNAGNRKRGYTQTMFGIVCGWMEEYKENNNWISVDERKALDIFEKHMNPKGKMNFVEWMGMVDGVVEKLNPPKQKQ